MGSRRILIADTDEHGANLLADRFRDLGHEVSVAHDPAGAVDCVMECQPDLAVIDLAMPGSSGFTVARQIQTLASDPVAIIFTTGKRRVEYRKLAEQSGAVGLFEKPYDADELLQAAAAALERSVPVAG
jgi:DNA-binding response OmpR family regulator